MCTIMANQWGIAKKSLQLACSEMYSGMLDNTQSLNIYQKCILLAIHALVIILMMLFNFLDRKSVV